MTDRMPVISKADPGPDDSGASFDLFVVFWMPDNEQPPWSISIRVSRRNGRVATYEQVAKLAAKRLSDFASVIEDGEWRPRNEA